jgi:hypothetical protein
VSPFLELAVPLVSKSLTLFVGTGLSKYLTGNNAPSWLELLIDLATRLDDKKGTLTDKLFNTESDGRKSSKYDPYVCAQILELEYRKRKEDIREAVVAVLDERINSRTIDSKKVTALAKFFEAHPDENLVTTNYDTLLSDHVLAGRFSRVFVEGSTVPKANIGTNIFHLHGCISDPQSIVLTINDYFKFQHRDTYLSRKFFTLLQETTVVIMGYSLGDFNLNSIFNEAQVSRAVSLRKSDIYLIARDSVDRTITDFYSYTYGVRVVAPYEIDEVFSNITESAPIAQKLIDQSGSLDRVLQGSTRWTDEYLKLADSFQRILLQASSIGVAVDDANFKKMLLDVLDRKRQFSREDNAWPQYEHLADWLVEIACLIDVKQAGISEEYLRLVDYSFRYMKKELIVGYSWAAFRVWRARFGELKIENQNLIREYATKNFHAGSDIAEVLNSV